MPWKKCPWKKCKPNIQNIFFVLKIRKQIFLTAGAAGGGGGGGALAYPVNNCEYIVNGLNYFDNNNNIFISQHYLSVIILQLICFKSRVKSLHQIMELE